MDSLLQSLSDGSARLAVSIRPVKERRKVPRTEAQLAVAFDAERPYDWNGSTINLSPVGVKVACPASAIRPSEGTSITLRLAAPDHGAMGLKAMVWRREPKAMVLLFVELGRDELKRLRDLVDTLRTTRPA